MNKQVQSNNKFEWMTTERIEKLILTLAWPTIISMLISSLYNMADTFFVGRLGTQATAGVGICFSVMAIIQAIGFTFGQGSGNTVARLLGRQDQETAAVFASTGFFTALGVSALLAVVTAFFLDPLVRLLGATPTIAPYAAAYLRFLLPGMPFIASSFVLNNLLRYQGSASYAMVGILTGAVLNIGLDPLLIYTFNMGVAGAALATSISQMVSFCVLLIQSSRGGNMLPSLKKYSFSPYYILTILKNGAATLLRQSLASLAAIALNTSAKTFGDAAIAAMSIVSRVIMFGVSALLGFGQGFQPVCGFNYGAGRHDRVRQAFWFSVKIATFVVSVLALVSLIFAPQIVDFFRTDDPEVIRIGALALRLQSLTLPLMPFITMAMMMTQTIGASAKASLLALARQGLFFIPIILALPHLLGLLGIQASQPISDLLSFTLSALVILPLLGQMKTQAQV